MKTASDPRHQKRQTLIQKLFEWSFRYQDFPIINVQKDSTLEKITQKKEIIDDEIKKAAIEWPIEQIAKVDLSILRLAVFELMFEKTIPQKVVIDEAIELAKEYGGEKSDKFVNGVLGTLVKSWAKCAK